MLLIHYYSLATAFIYFFVYLWVIYFCFKIYSRCTYLDVHTLEL